MLDAFPSGHQDLTVPAGCQQESPDFPERGEPLMKLKKWFRQHPIPDCIIVALLVFLLLGAVGLLRKQLPESMAVDYARNLVNILWPLGLTLLLGYGWCYRRGSFGKTLFAGLAALILFTVTFLIRAGQSLLADDTPWKNAAGIILGIINIFGIGFREETIFRGVIANNLGIAFGKDARGVWKAVILSGLIFGLVHLANIVYGVDPLHALIQTVSACAIGIYYTAIYFRGGSLWALVLLHCMTDAGGMFRSAFTTAATQTGQVNELSVTGLVMVPIYIGIAVFLLRKKKMDAVLENLNQAAQCDE